MSFFTKFLASGLILFGAGYVSGVLRVPWDDQATSLMVGIVFLGVSCLSVADEVIEAIHGSQKK